jgi:hypothetical protein
MKLELELGVPNARVPDGVDRVRPVAAYDSPEVFARDVEVRVPKTREAKSSSQLIQSAPYETFRAQRSDQPFAEL